MVFQHVSVRCLLSPEFNVVHPHGCLPKGNQPLHTFSFLLSRQEVPQRSSPKLSTARLQLGPLLLLSLPLRLSPLQLLPEEEPRLLTVPGSFLLQGVVCLQHGSQPACGSDLPGDFSAFLFSERRAGHVCCKLCCWPAQGRKWTMAV